MATMSYPAVVVDRANRREARSLFARRRRGWVGVDFGSAAVKMVQLERVGTQWCLAHVRILPRPDLDSLPSHAPLSAPWWSTLDRNEPMRRGFVGRSAACILSASQLDLRAMNLPDGSDTERRAMIHHELLGIFADATPRSFDFWETSVAGPGSEPVLDNVNVLSLPEELASVVVKTLACWGLRCERIDGLPLALARALALFPGLSDNTPLAAVDWGYHSATFCLLVGPRPVFTRNLRDCGFARFHRAVSEALGLPASDVQELLRLYGLKDPSASPTAFSDVQEVIADVTSAAVRDMISELNRTLAYPELHRSGLVPRAIWLFGAGATVRNMAECLASALRIPVETWRLPESAARAGPWPAALLGPAVALSALAWNG